MASNSIELKKLQVELARVQVGRMELELKIAERLEDIQRLEEHVKLSAAKEAELIQSIEHLQVIK